MKWKTNFLKTLQIVEARIIEGKHLLPDLRPHYDGDLSSRVNQSLMFDQATISECLKTSGLETGKLQQGSAYTGNSLQHRCALS